MKKRTFRIVKGWIFWLYLKIWYKIDYRTIVLVLTGNHDEVDYYCLKYLKEFISRKYAKKGILFCTYECYETVSELVRWNSALRVIIMNTEKMSLLYEFYSFMKFFENIVFTYTDCPTDNYLGRYLRETDITAADAVCLALYHLRCVPARG